MKNIKDMTTEERKSALQLMQLATPDILDYLIMRHEVALDLDKSGERKVRDDVKILWMAVLEALKLIRAMFHD